MNIFFKKEGHFDMSIEKVDLLWFFYANICKSVTSQ